MKTEISIVEKMAHLARLQLKPTEIEGTIKSMDQILNWMEKLNELDLEQVKPLVHMSAELNAFREDKLKTTITREEAFQNAPNHDGQYFKVPKVIDQG